MTTVNIPKLTAQNVSINTRLHTNKLAQNEVVYDVPNKYKVANELLDAPSYGSWSETHIPTDSAALMKSLQSSVPFPVATLLGDSIFDTGNLDKIIKLFDPLGINGRTQQEIDAGVPENYKQYWNGRFSNGTSAGDHVVALSGARQSKKSEDFFGLHWVSSINE